MGVGFHQQMKGSEEGAVIRHLAKSGIVDKGVEINVESYKGGYSA